MNSSQKIVLLVGSAVEPQAILGAAAGETIESLSQSAGSTRSPVFLVSYLRPAAAIPGVTFNITIKQAGGGAFERILADFGLFALGRWIERFPIGRLISTFGPMDQSRVFRRAIRHNQEAMELVSSATVLIAVDLPAVRTAWDAARTGRVPLSLFDLPAALRVLKGRQSGKIPPK